MPNKIFLGDVGTIILIDMGENISAATNITLDIIAPKSYVNSDGSVSDGKTWTPTIEGTNFLKYTIVAGDLDQIGIYKINPKLKLGDWIGHGETVEFEVFNRGT